MPIQQITIVGTGLIGGSLALALRQSGFTLEQTWCDRKKWFGVHLARV